MTDTTTEGRTLMGDMRLAWQLLRDSESPFYLKLLPLAAGLYFIAPEFFVGGPFLATPIDDVALMYAALKGIIGLAPPHLVAKYTGDQSLNYVDGDYEIVEDGQAAPEAPQSAPVDGSAKDLGEDIIIDPDKHNW